MKKKTRKTVPTAPDMLLAMKGAFYDLWLDTEERPRIRRAHTQVRKLLALHLAETEMWEAEQDFVKLQKRIDLGLSRGEEGIERDIIPAQEGLRDIYERLFEAIFGVRPKRGE